MRKSAILGFIAAGCLLWSCSPKTDVEANYQVIPLPAEISLSEAPGFRLTDATVIAYPAGDEPMKKNAEFLAGYISQLTGNDVKVTDQAADKDVIVLSTGLENENPEAYRMDVSADRITIDGASPAGVFYGIQTLRKSIPDAGKQNVTFPAAVITDAPAFGYRGVHLDVSRHFFPADSVKTFIDMLALHNLNRLHWHLTDDQGWRIEIKSRPELTELGSQRGGTVIGHNSGVYDSIPYGGFYTQDEVLDIIRYAADRHITIVPEIDMPGHMLGALKAYPELGCTGGPYEVWQQWGVSEDVLCAGNDSTYKFLDDVFGEIIELFPSEYIHLGGDECPKTSWKNCPKCQARIKELGLKADSKHTAEEKLQSHVVGHVNEFLKQHGRKAIGWDEILEGGAADGATIMSWRGEAGGIEAARQGHDVIMTPNSYFYFDYYQALDTKNEPDAIGGYVPVEKVYSYNPMPTELTPEEAKHIIGVQANIWTEYMPTFSQVEYMAMPRVAALSEVQWNSVNRKDYQDFAGRLPQLINQYKVNGYNYAKHVFDVRGSITPDTEKHVVKVELSTADNAPIHYTLDGSEPTAASAEYTEPLELDKSSVIKAVAVRPSGTSKVFVDSVTFNKATCRPVELLTEPSHAYRAKGPSTLVDGKFGSSRYNTGDWIGFNGNDAVVVVDLGEPTTISEVLFNTCVATNDWVFDARSITVEVSADGKDYTKVASTELPTATKHSSGVVENKLSFDPVEATYVKVTVGCEKSIPDWHAGKGKNGFVFIDEIVIN